MIHSESIAAISAALAKAQGAIEGARKDNTNPHFKSKYADLASCWDACREHLSANEIAVIQAPGEVADGVVELTTMLCHSSGEFFSEKLPIPLAKIDAQGLGSAITYARRYALCAMVGIAPEDDDGNAATAHGPVENSRQRSRPAPASQSAIDEPEEGWAAWAVGLIGHLGEVGSDAAIEAARNDETNKRRINALRMINPPQYQAIGKAFQEARARVTKPATADPEPIAA